MKYLSTFSGIEAATVAWHPLGWEPVGFSEIEPFPCAVLKHHYPQTPNYGDITRFRTWSVEPFQLLVGGSPCQSFSVAGLRKGLADERGNLMLEFGRLAEHYRPTWVVWENVPGVLSSNGGRDFASFLTMLAEFGYGFAYRVLDAQYFGVPQRRRRVFVVGHLGDWRPAAAVLFDPHSLSGHPPPSREKRQGASGCVKAGSHWSGGPHPSLNQSNNIGGIGISNQELFSQGGAGLVEGTWRDGSDIAATLTKSNANGAQRMPDKDNFGAVLQPMAYNVTFCDANGRRKDRPNGGLYVNEADTTNTLTQAPLPTLVVPQPVTYDMQQVTAPVNKQSRKPGDPCHTLSRDNAGNAALVQPMAFDTYNYTVNDETTQTVRRGTDNEHIGCVVQPMAFKVRGGCEGGGKGYLGSEDCAFTLSTGVDQHIAQPMCIAPTLTAANNPSRSPQSSEVTQQVASVVAAAMQVRRLTPTECERLQGFPDGYTAIPWKNKPAEQCPDGPRYKALGNSMAVPVMRWIGERIQAVEDIIKEL